MTLVRLKEELQRAAGEAECCEEQVVERWRRAIHVLRLELGQLDAQLRGILNENREISSNAVKRVREGANVCINVRADAGTIVCVLKSSLAISAGAIKPLSLVVGEVHGVHRRSAYLSIARYVLDSTEQARERLNKLTNQAITTENSDASHPDRAAPQVVCEELKITRLVAAVQKLVKQIASGTSNRLKLCEVARSRGGFLVNRCREVLHARAEASLLRLGWPKTSRTVLKVGDRGAMRRCRELMFCLAALQAYSCDYDDWTYLEDGWWGMKLLLDPLEKRFNYHFHRSAAKTNRIDKPEWIFSFVSMTLAKHLEAVDMIAASQTARADRAFWSGYNPRAEFISGMVQLVNKKLTILLTQLSKQDDLAPFLNVIDHVVAFEENLRTLHEYPLNRKGAFASLCTPPMFNIWLEAEKLSLNLQLDHIWDPDKPSQLQFDTMELIEGTTLVLDAEDRDSATDKRKEVRLTRAAELIVSILRKLSNRYRMLPLLRLQLRFADELQKQVVDVFVTEVEDRLESSLREMSKGGLRSCFVAVSHWEQYCGLLNTLVGLRIALEDMAEEVEFLELECFRVLQGDHAGEYDSQNDMTVADVTLHPEFENATGSFFIDLTERMLTLSEEFLICLHKVVLKVFHLATASYRARGHLWSKITLPTVEGENETPAVTDVSIEFCDALSLLKSMMSLVESLLMAPLFSQFWKGVASGIDLSLFEDVILHNYFSFQGVLQLSHDVEALAALFWSYTIDSKKLFRKTNQAIEILLIDRHLVLHASQSWPGENRPDAREILAGPLSNLTTSALTEEELEEICERLVTLAGIASDQTREVVA